MKLVGGNVRGQCGKFTVQLQDQQHVFDAGPMGAHYIMFEERMAAAIPLITPVGPIAGGVISTADFLRAAKERGVPEGADINSTDPVRAIEKAIDAVLAQKSEKPMAATLLEFMGAPGNYGGVRCLDKGVIEYMTAAHPGGAVGGDHYHLDALVVVHNQLDELVTKIISVKPSWPGLAQAEEPAEGSDTLEALVQRALLGDRNADPAIFLGAKKAVERLGTKSNQHKHASCFSRGGPRPVRELLEEAQKNMIDRLGTSLTLEEVAMSLNRLQGVFTYDPRTKTISARQQTAL